MSSEREHFDLIGHDAIENVEWEARDRDPANPGSVNDGETLRVLADASHRSVE